MRNKQLFVAIASAALITGSAIAAGATVKAGDSIYDTSGGSVGTIKSVTGDLAVVSTGTNEVSLPVSSFGAGEKGPILAMTKSQLDAAATSAKASAQADLAAAIKPGAQVYGATGTPVGTIDTADAQYATLSVGAKKVKLPINAISKTDKGLTIGMTAEQLNAAVEASASTAPSASAM